MPSASHLVHHNAHFKSVCPGERLLELDLAAQHHRHDNNENNDAAVNNACATTAPPTGSSPACFQGASKRCSISPLSEASGAVIGSRSPLTERQANPGTVGPSSGGGKSYGLRNRCSLRPTQESEFEYSEFLLQQLDESEKQAHHLTCGNDALPEYEQQRRERIAANLRKLQALGLQNGVVDSTGKKVTKVSKRKNLSHAQEEPPLRRSSRRRTAFFGLHDISPHANHTGTK